MFIANTEIYRSGHNEAVLKTVCRQRHGGSNPSISAKTLWVDEIYPKGFFVLLIRGIRTKAFKKSASAWHFFSG